MDISSGITCPFGQLSQCPGYVSDTLLTLAPLSRLLGTVRLACLNHAASVQAEPGSNSSIKFLGTTSASCPVNAGSKACTTKSYSFGSCVCPRNRVHPTNRVQLRTRCKAQTPSLASDRPG